MKSEHLLIIAGVAIALYLYTKKGGAGAANLHVQTNPASRNTNTGVGTSDPNSWLNQGAQIVNGGASLFTTTKTALAGLGSGSTPGKTVGIATTATPAVSSGNYSFDNQDYFADTSGSDMSEYSSLYL